MIGRLDGVIFDVPDLPRLTEFYRALTGWSVTSSDDEWATLTLPDGRRVHLQAAPDHIPPRWPDPDDPAQLHLDFVTHDIEAAADRAVRLGATRLGATDTGGPRAPRIRPPGPDGPPVESKAWMTLADPAGHPFDLCFREGAGDGVSVPMGLYGICIDTHDAAMLSRFYAELLGLPLTWEGDEGAILGREDGTIYLQKVARHVRPQWPDPAHPQQGHLDVQVEDVDEAERRVLAIGATKLRDGDGGFRVYADPSGHPFCLIYDE